MSSRDFAFPGTRARYAPDRVVQLRHLALVLDVDPHKRAIAGTATLHAALVDPEATALELDAVELDIAKVTIDGKPATFRHDGKRLRVELPGKLAGPTIDRSASDFALAIDYRGAPRRGIYFNAPDDEYPDRPLQVWTQGQDEDSRYWFPCFDAPNQKATSSVTVTVPAPLFALSNGALASDKTKGKHRTLAWKLDVPHSCYLVTLVVGDFTPIETTWRDVPVVYYVQRGREAEAERTLARTPQMLELFAQRFGVAYPYPRYAQVFVADFIFGGMENTSATTLTDTVLLDERAAIDHDVDSLVAHELAHQWFGDLLTCRDWGEGWLNEGFATYAEYIWREHFEGRDAADVELDGMADMYFGEDASRYRRPIATKLYDEPIDIFDAHLYDKGGRVLHMLRHVVGDAAFWKTLAHYLGKHRFGVVESRDFARAVDDATGKVLDWFFAQWVIEGSGHPELKIAIAWDAARSLATVRVEQAQTVDAKTPVFRLPTSVRFRVGAKDVDLPIEIVEQKQTFQLRLDAEPTQAIFDPGAVLLAKRDFDKAEPLWIAELAHATLASDRRAAARALGRRAGPAAEKALASALVDDKHWAVRAAAAAALGELRTPAARDRLIKRLVGEVHPRARRAIARALGEFTSDAAAGAALATVVAKGDASCFVEAEACLALGRTRAPRAGELLRAAAARESYNDIVRSHAFRGLAEARDDGALNLLVDGTKRGRPSQGRRAAASALAMLVRGRRDREARDVRERLERLLADADFRVQAAALEALGTIGDGDAIAAVRRLVDRELDGRLRRRGKEIARDLAAAAPLADELHRLRDDLGELRRVATELRGRVELLEASKAASKRPARAAKKPRR
jgi:aminopeptidase N